MADEPKGDPAQESKPADSVAADADRPVGVAQLPPLPPGLAPGQQFQVALGLQLMRQSSLERLPHDIQQELIRLADQMDNRGYEYAQRSLEKEAEIEREGIQDRGKGRKQILWVLSGMTGLGVVAGTFVTYLLIAEKQYAMAHTVMMSGLAVISALLGGAGLATVIQKLTGGK